MKVRELIREFRDIKNEDHTKGLGEACTEISNALEKGADLLRTAAKIADVSSKVLKKPETVLAISRYARTAMSAAADMYIEILEANEELIDDTVLEINEPSQKVKEAREKLHRMRREAYVASKLKEDEEEGIEYDEFELNERIKELREDYDYEYAC